MKSERGVLADPQTCVKRLVQKRKTIAEEVSLKPQEDATKKRKVKGSDQLKHRGVTSQLQEGWNNRNEPPKVDEKGAKTSGSNSLLEGKEEITTPEKNRKIIRKKNLYFNTSG